MAVIRNDKKFFLMTDWVYPFASNQTRHEMMISCHEMTILILFPASRLCFGWLQSNGTDLPAHTIDSNTHITRMLSYNKAIVYIQIKHGAFDCKVHKQKRHVKGGLFRMVTKEAAPYPSRTRGGILSYAI